MQQKQDELLGRTNDLILKLKDFESDDPLRFDRVSLAGREKVLRIVLDGRVARNPNEHVTIQVCSPLQRLLAPELDNDEEIKQRSLPEPNTFFLRMAQVHELRRALVQMVATTEVADYIMNSGQNGNPEYEVARLAKTHDVAEYRRAVSHYLDQAVRQGMLFFRGTAYYLEQGENAQTAVRSALSQLLPLIFARFNDLPHRIHDDTRAVRDALNNVVSNPDLVALKIYKNDGTLNEGNPLLSTLRSRIPLEQAGLGMLSADQLRQELEKPPFGWDSSCVKIGLALLLRASACHLVEGGKTYTDPSHPDVLQMLTKEQRFKALRVQALRTEIEMPELLEIRGYIDTIFDVKLPLVMATLNDKLKEQLYTLHTQALDLENWAKVARCSLPLAFESGTSLVAELIESNAPNVRLPHFKREWETLLNYQKLTQELTHFKATHGNEYVEVLRFFTSMVNVENPPEAIHAFQHSWRALDKERAAPDFARWSTQLQSYHAARQALTDQVAILQHAAQQELAELTSSLPKRVQEAGLPETEVDGALAELQALLQPLPEHIEQHSATLSEARALRSTLMSQRMRLSSTLREIQMRYQTAAAPPAPPQEVKLHWSTLLGTCRISSPDDLKQVLESLQRQVYPELEQHHIVIID